MSERPIGTGHVAAMARLGLKELRNAVNPSRESVADSEMGLYGTQTQGEIAQARGGAGAGPEQENAQENAQALSLERMREQVQQTEREAQPQHEQEQVQQAQLEQARER